MADPEQGNRTDTSRRRDRTRLNFLTFSIIFIVRPFGALVLAHTAAHIIDEPALWDAGARMMRADDSDAWQAVVAATELMRANHTTIVPLQFFTKTP